MRNKLAQSFRQAGALKRLQGQLESGVKTKKGTSDEKIPLTDKDIQRINKEISKLKTKV